MYRTGEDGTYTPYEGYCDETLIKNYVKEIGNALNGGCGFEIDASKTNIGMIALIQFHLKEKQLQKFSNVMPTLVILYVPF